MQRDDLTFAQITVRFIAQHKFAAFDKRNQLKAGDPNRVIPVQDVWVLERGFIKEAHSRWRLAGRIGGIQPEAMSRSWSTWFSEWVYGSKRT